MLGCFLIFVILDSVAFPSQQVGGGTDQVADSCSEASLSVVQDDLTELNSRVQLSLRDLAGNSGAAPTVSSGRRMKKRSAFLPQAKRKKLARSPSSSSSSEEGSSSSSSSSEQSSEDVNGSNWQLLKGWPVSARPAVLQDKRKVNALSMKKILNIQQIHLNWSSSVKDSLEVPDKDEKPVMRKFKKSKDDGFKHLHPARFLQAPFSHPKKWFRYIPQKRDVLCKSLNLEFLGCANLVADKTIINLHNRTVPLLLKHFSSENAGVASKPRREVRRVDDDGYSVTTDLSWEVPLSLTAVQEAVSNFACINAVLWPLDPTGSIMQRLLMKYKWFTPANDAKTRIEVVTSYFNNILKRNANRAVNGEPVLSFDEHESVLKGLLQRFGLPGDPPTQAPLQIKQRQVPTSGSSQQSLQDVCFGFNATDGSRCKNKPIPGGCRSDRGREFVHKCTAFNPATGRRCFGKHPRKDHK